MTTVTYFNDKDEISIEIKGHAEYGKVGEDIVCSAVSMLGQTLLKYLEVNHEKFDYSLRSGYIWAYSKGEHAVTALAVIMSGFYMLSQEYPDHIKLNRGCSMQRTP